MTWASVWEPVEKLFQDFWESQRMSVPVHTMDPLCPGLEPLSFSAYENAFIQAGKTISFLLIFSNLSSKCFGWRSRISSKGVIKKILLGNTSLNCVSKGNFENKILLNFISQNGLLSLLTIVRTYNSVFVYRPLDCHPFLEFTWSHSLFQCQLASHNWSMWEYKCLTLFPIWDSFEDLS